MLETTILENDTTAKSNIEQAIEPDVKASEPVEQPTEVETPENAIEIDGEKLTVSQIKKLKEDYGNDSKWRDKNRRESEELNKKKERYQKLELIEPFLEQHPEKFLEIIKPQTRDFDKELEEHYKKKATLPTIEYNGAMYVDPNAQAQWEMQKDKLVIERGRYESTLEARKTLEKEYAERENNKVEMSAKQKYVDSKKIDENEFLDMEKWMVENLRPKNGVFQEKDFDLAFKTIHEDKWLREIKLEATQKAVEPLSKSTRSDNGKSKPKVSPTPQDEDDDSFVQLTRQKQGGKWITL